MTGVSLTAAAWVVLQSSDSASPTEKFLILSVVFLVSLYAVYWGFGQWKLSRLIQDTPTEKVRSMSAGRTELEGTVREADGTVDPPYTESEAVYVDWSAQRRERHRDDDGNVEYRWETVASGREVYPFALEDDTGRALIRADADDPTVDINGDDHRTTVTYHQGEQPPAAVSQFVNGGDAEGGAEAESGDGGFIDSAVDAVSDAMDRQALHDTGHRRRYKQSVLPVGSHVYAFGSAQPRQDASMEAGQQDLLELRRHEGTDRFLISDSEEEELQESYSRRGPVVMALGLLVSAVSLYYLLSWFILPAL